MIDYAKILLPVEVGARLLRHPGLSFIGKFDHATGAVLGDAPCIAEYGPTTAIGRAQDAATDRKALQFIVYPSGRTILRGSFHKYAQGGTNWGDYTFTQFVATVTELCGTFDLDPHAMRLLQLEAGVNIVLAMPTPDALQAVVCHREGHAFSPMRSHGGTSLGLDLYRDQFGIKIYDKGWQYGLSDEVLRFEVKFTKAIQFQGLGVYTLNDLLNIGAWERLRDRVLGIFDELHIREPAIDPSRLTDPERMFLAFATTPAYWQGLSKSQRHRARKQYADIVSRFTETPLKGLLRASIAGKMMQMIAPEPTLGAPIHPCHADPVDRGLIHRLTEP